MASITLPSLGSDMDEGTLLEWRVAPGDPVGRGQIVAVVDTAKAAVDVECWQEGTVAELKVQPGQKVPVGTVLATLRTAEAVAEGAPTPHGDAAASSEGAPTPLAAPVPAPALGREATKAVSAAMRRPISPAARARARELGLDPTHLTGSGPGGAVSLADVQAAGRAVTADQALAAAQAPAEAPASAARTPEAAAVTDPAGQAAAARQAAMRATIASAMSRSQREIPAYHLVETIPMAAALDWLGRCNTERPVGQRILPAALWLKAVALALLEAPALNGHFREGRFEPQPELRLGIAIALRGGGLVAPALVQPVADMPLDALMAALEDLVRRARAGSLRSSELADPSITVTALGDQGAEEVHGVIHPPQVALVGFGRIVEQAWADNGWLRAMPVVRASLAADHRVSDGHLGSRFLADLRDRLQQPERLAQGRRA